jgi:hypothetical protein
MLDVLQAQLHRHSHAADIGPATLIASLSDGWSCWSSALEIQFSQQLKDSQEFYEISQNVFLYMKSKWQQRFHRISAAVVTLGRIIWTDMVLLWQMS